ncbi:hypothetical protein CH275_09450 [Rhodococcus sp. 06-235-1A]|uniref:DUF2510 domain-containing protein n=1 Tax=Rhodococcus sp. 06-235-1A TaxID=2022508 RepID=UPI000B9AB48F|nr:hypothetical protein CH275_09450 [Rhodococcus sp. 06-235-1A]
MTPPSNGPTGSSRNPAPGWYPDPQSPSLRWWDGQSWTNEFAPVPGASAALRSSRPTAAPQGSGSPSNDGQQAVSSTNFQHLWKSSTPGVPAGGAATTAEQSSGSGLASSATASSRQSLVRVTYVAHSGLQQVWDMQVDQSATSEHILAELRAERPDVTTIVNVERLDNGPSQPRSAHTGNTLMHSAGGSPRRKVVVVCAVAIAVLAVGVWQVNSHSRDELSYRAGQETGTTYATSFTALSSDSWSDDSLRTDCGTLAATSGRRVGDQFVEKDDIDREDFVDGCYDAARPIIPR